MDAADLAILETKTDLMNDVERGFLVELRRLFDEVERLTPFEVDAENLRQEIDSTKSDLSDTEYERDDAIRERDEAREELADARREAANLSTTLRARNADLAELRAASVRQEDA